MNLAGQSVVAQDDAGEPNVLAVCEVCPVEVPGFELREGRSVRDTSTALAVSFGLASPAVITPAANAPGWGI